MTSPVAQKVEYTNANIIEHPRYGLVLKLMLRDEGEDSIRKRLETNKVPEYECNLLLRRTQKVRNAFVRSHHYRKVFIGLFVLSIALIVFSFFWFYVRAIPRMLLGMCILTAIYGFWVFVDGVTGCIAASNHRGEIADIINE